ncbi:MAG: peptidylprolyl isomerase [Geodermatophilaceae bacterium]|nr:peptidylprolyl isomerase [Geodermatophilaceae bacterium]
MATNKQRREAARRQLQRQLERRAEEARKRRRNLLVGVAAFSVVIVIGGVLWFTGVFDAPAAPAASTDAQAVACTYTPADPTANPNLKDVGIPPASEDSTTPVVLDVASSQGAFQMTLDPTTAPCATNSMKYLAQNAFFDGSPCHRLVNSDVFGVLQCGDPSGTGSGGPTYNYVSEPDSVAGLAPAPDGTSSTYPKGSVAMAQGGQPPTIGSQFFICFQDTQLPPDYTLVGTITSGLDVIEAVAAAGNNGSFETAPDGSPGPGGGAPNLPISLTTVTVAPAVS